jgi:phosphohistidine phosphatase
MKEMAHGPQLILWRHAEAEDLAEISGNRRAVARRSADLERALTRRGRGQARAIAAWLRPRLPEGARVLVSPARRCVETAHALTRHYEELPELGPTRDTSDLLGAIGWPDLTDTVVVVGHQPTLGRIAALLIGGKESNWSVKKGAVWWIARRSREDETQHVIRAVIAPDQVRD